MLSFCNDVARYYRTLCIEYKAKIDAHDKSWAVRNAKLRHCRKFWYFSTMLCVAAIAECENDEAAFVERLLDELRFPPIVRLCHAADILSSVRLAELFERYAFFLEYMASTEHRKALEGINYEERNLIGPQNPYAVVKLNSDLLHREMIRIIDQLPYIARERVIGWFML